MRLLPKTPRGTWLLAGAGWLAGSALLWGIVPLRPRAEWACAQQVGVGYICDRRTIVTYPFTTDGLQHGPLCFREADSGRVVEWFDAGECIDPDMALSPNGAWIAVFHGRPEPREFQLFETSTGRARSDLPLAAESFPQGVCFSADSRWLAYVQRGYPDECIRVWDVNADTLSRTLRPVDGLPKFNPGLRLAFGPDGQTLAAADCAASPQTKNVTRIQLWDWKTARLIGTLQGPASESCGCLQFSPDGGHLVAEFYRRGPQPAPNYQVLCWDLNDGRETLRLPAITPVVTPSGLWVRASDPTAPMQQSMQAWDYAGRRIRKLDRIGGLGPNARTLAYVSARPTPVRDWMTAHGLPWPFPAHQEIGTRLVDVEAEKDIANLPPWQNKSQIAVGAHVFFSPDGQLYAERIDGGIRIWDVPPRKSLTWFVVGAILVALPPFLIARRRVRRLRQGAVA